MTTVANRLGRPWTGTSPHWRENGLPETTPRRSALILRGRRVPGRVLGHFRLRRPSQKGIRPPSGGVKRIGQLLRYSVRKYARLPDRATVTLIVRHRPLRLLSMGTYPMVY